MHVSMRECVRARSIHLHLFVRSSFQSFTLRVVVIRGLARSKKSQTYASCHHYIPLKMRSVEFHSLNTLFVSQFSI